MVKNFHDNHKTVSNSFFRFGVVLIKNLRYLRKILQHFNPIGPGGRGAIKCPNPFHIAISQIFS